MPKWTYMSVPSHFGNFIFCRFLWQIVCLFFILSCPSYPVSVDLRVFCIIAISIIWRAASWGATCRRRHLSALQTMEMPLDGAKYDWLLNLQTLILPWERKTLYRKSRNLSDEKPKPKLPKYVMSWEKKNIFCFEKHLQIENTGFVKTCDEYVLW